MNHLIRRAGSFWRIAPLSFAIALVFLILVPSTWASTYYVDSASGNDSNPGTQALPWKTLTKVNSASLAGGDSVLFMRGRTWFEAPGLVPVSGSSGNPITYGAYGAGAKPIIDNCQLVNKSYVTIQDITFHAMAALGKTPMYVSNSTRCTILRCDIYTDKNNIGTVYASVFVRDGSSYNQFINCYVERSVTADGGDGMNVSKNAHHNLVQGCTFGPASHYALVLEGDSTKGQTSSYNILRNNTIRNTLGSGISVLADADYNVIEGNAVYELGSNQFAASPTMLRLNARYLVGRKNLLFSNYQSNGAGIEVSAWSGVHPYKVRAYNNTLVDIDGGPAPTGGGSILLDWAAETVDDVAFVNNILYTSRTVENFWFVNYRWYTGITNVTFRNNLIYKSAGTLIRHRYSGGTYLWSRLVDAEGIYQSIYPRGSNLQLDPMLDTTYQPRAGSPCIDGGAFLTTVSSASASGSSFAVADPYYFFDGYGISSGDQIRVGNESTTITAINYATGQLTVSPPVSWQSGAPVSILYAGTRPDIGAFENNAPPTTLSPPVNLRVIEVK